MNTRPARVLRGLAAAFVAVFVAAMSHVAGGGGAPGTVGLVLAAAFSAVVCVALAGRSLSIIRLTASVVVSQGLLHALFSVGQSSADGVSVTMSGMGHHGTLVVATGSAGASSASEVAASLCPEMLFAHAVAALITVLALRRGETAFWGLLRLAGLRFTRLVRPLFLEPSTLERPGVPRAVAVFDHLRDLGVFLGGLRHRGPPVCVRFAL